MDLDIDMDDAAEAVLDMHEDELPRGEDILQPDEPEEPGEVADDDKPSQNHIDQGLDASRTLVSTKIHLRGLDTLHTDDIKAWVRSHYGAVDRVEWIDDTSANLTFPSEPAARDAIVALSAVDMTDASALAIGETLPAKPVEGRPQVSLHLRFAVQSDKKEAGAALRSRYYLLHPEHDPEERRRRQHERPSRYRERERRDRRPRRDQYDDEYPDVFDASMYDDPTPKPTDDVDDGNHDRLRAQNQGKELFSGRAVARDRGPRTRTRSASPRRDTDVDMDADDALSRNKTQARSIKDRLSIDNKARELFPSKGSSRGGGGQLDQLERAIGSAHLREDDMPKIVTAAKPTRSLRDDDDVHIRGAASHKGQRGNGNAGFSIKGAASAKELFPDKLGPNNGKELIPKQRQKAEDLFS